MATFNRLKPGETVALYGCPAQNAKGETVALHGLFELVDYEGTDWSAGITTSGWVLVPTGTSDDDWEQAILLAGDEDVFEQVNPQAYGRTLVQEREMALAGEEL